jgi:hypothetical protein
MKKLTTLLLLVSLATSIMAGNVIHTYNSSSPTVKEVGSFNVISFKDMFLTGKTGEPALPYQAVKLLLPPGEEAVSVNFTFEDEELLDGTYTIYPQQPAEPISVGTDGKFHQDMAVYSSSGDYPAQAWGQYSTQFLNGHSFLLTSFTPVKYIPATGQVSFFHKVTVSVETRTTERAAAAFDNINTNANINNRVKELAQNPTMLASYPARTNRDGEYQVLIITPQQFVNDFQTLKDLYLVRGFVTEVATTENINATVSGQDLQEKIRNYIIGEYQNHGIESVLLGGDEEYIPHRGFYCLVHSSSDYEDYNIPSDLYYSGLDGNWNTNGDDKWAEIGEDDLLPDVAVARFPFSTEDQLLKIMHKTTMYQDQPVQGELQKVISAGEQLWTDPLTYGEDYLELLFGHREDNGYTTDGVPLNFTYNKLYDSQSGWDAYSLMNAINQGTTFVHHSGHANQTYVMRMNITDITNQNFLQTNGTAHNYPLVYTHGCLCGAFDENDCIGEAMVLIDNFAVGGAFNSRYGWFNEGQTEGPSAHLHREFVNALFHDGVCRLGTAHQVSRIETAPWVNAPGQWEENALRWCFYCCNIFGDPMLGVWTDEPMTIVTQYPEYIEPGTTQIPVTVTSNGLPVSGLMCVILSNENMIGCCQTDSSGQAVVQVPSSFADITTAQLVVSGNNCLPNYYTITSTVGVNEISGKISHLQVSPNPFGDHFMLTFNLDKSQDVKISFYSISGQEIDTKIVTGKEGLNNIRINSTDWPEGVIQARISTESGISHLQLVHTGN